MAEAARDQADGAKTEGATQSQEMSEKPQQDGNEQVNGTAPAAAKEEKDGQLQAQQQSQQQQQSSQTSSDNKDNEKKDDKKDDKDKDKQPEGGYDSTPIPKPPPGTIGYTIKFTFHSASALTIGDMGVMSSDPYILAQLNTDLQPRHKEDPRLRFRSPTIQKNLNPTWNEEWIVANVPSTGFKLKVRVYDEDPADHDDMLGKVHITVPSLDDNWAGIKKESHSLTLRDSSKRALLIRAVARCFGMVNKFQGEVTVSAELLGRTENKNDGQNGKAYTLGPVRWCQHYSPILGRLANIKEPSEGDTRSPSADKKRQQEVQKYNFQANEFQLPGPVPAELYHRFVEFRPWVKRMFTTTGFQGVLLGKALHHQHNRVYNFSRDTVWGHFPQGPSEEMTKKFLELAHYAQGGRIFTYIITLDALWRFTETGPQISIDMLSKHTMHSDVSIYIAFSGEFFLRRLKHRRRPPPPDPVDETSQRHPPSHQTNEIEAEAEDEPPKDPSHYELVIDNDSGTYRPNAQKLPLLADFLAHCLPGLHIQTLDCQADADKMKKMKDAQRERKKKTGDHVVYAQGDDSSSISSEEHEALDDAEQAGAASAGGGVGSKNRLGHTRRHGDFATGDGGAREHGAFVQLTKDAKLQGQAKLNKFSRNYGGRSREDVNGGDGEEEAAAS